MAFVKHHLYGKQALKIALLGMGAFLCFNSQGSATEAIQSDLSVYLSQAKAVNTNLSVTTESQTKVNRRVQFAPGSSSIVIKGSVPLGSKDTYVFRARKGQTIITDIRWAGSRVGGENEEGLSGFTFIWPNGKSLPDPQDIYFKATSTGEYRVVIAQPYRLTSSKYTFKLTIQ